MTPDDTVPKAAVPADVETPASAVAEASVKSGSKSDGKDAAKK